MIFDKRGFIFCILFLSFAFIYVNAGDLDYKKVHYIQSTPPLANGNVNYIFRGNEPRENVNGTTIFAYDDLVSFIKQNGQENNITIPDQFYLIDIKLITGPLPSELPDIELEQNFFAQNSNLGEFHTNNTFGDLLDPQWFDEEEQISMAKTLPNWQKDDLQYRMDLYHNILFTERDLPVVLYIHCECGCDRTGEIMASWVMRFQGWNFAQAMEWDYSIAGRKINFANQWATQWYCLYLQYAENRSIDCTPPANW
ncbi:hypothetical protein CYY_004104 [Polysphondylium violaceum]|uniref:Tyrosine specific protein phosphatases domain-containing protein n=1 Tax=Polysphondylium violaceum TaxID=133409 RepID=A0A8J4V5J1_9MYCE|nr:hypothetical protein CYY_004104 [Polysphondylium violaceum]